MCTDHHWEHIDCLHCRFTGPRIVTFHYHSNRVSFKPFTLVATASSRSFHPAPICILQLNLVIHYIASDILNAFPSISLVFLAHYYLGSCHPTPVHILQVNVFQHLQTPRTSSNPVKPDQTRRSQPQPQGDRSKPNKTSNGLSTYLESSELRKQPHPESP